jgi:hypothetical protein
MTRIGYGNAEGKSYMDIGSREKELIGDALRNAAMRFGAALELWHKGQLHVDIEGEEKPPVIDGPLWNTAEAEARKGTQAFRAYWKALSKADRDQLEGRMEGLKGLAQTADIAGFTKEMDKADAAI